MDPTTPPISGGIIEDNIVNLSLNSPREAELYIDPSLLEKKKPSFSPALDNPRGASTLPNTPANPASFPTPFVSGGARGNIQRQSILQSRPSFPVSSSASLVAYSSPEPKREGSSSPFPINSVLHESNAPAKTGDRSDVSDPGLKTSPSPFSGQVLSNIPIRT